jgi:VWFA-related protein
MTTRRAFCSVLAGGAAFAQQGLNPPNPAKPDQDEVITLDVTRVNLLFTVSDRRGRFVNNLTKEEFEIIESKRRQSILEFVAESDLPLRIGVLVDTSNSIRDRFKFEIEAATQFLESVIRKGRDRALVYSFDTNPELVQDLTDDTHLLASKLRALRPGGGTALYDAIATACRDKLMRDQPRHKFRRAAVIIGDGDDNASHYTRDQALEFANKAEVVIYCISTNVGRMENDGDKVLKYFAQETGGLAFFPFRAQDLAQDFENIANELRSQYSLLYRPEPLKTDGRYQRIEVRVRDRKDLLVRCRKGYYAPLM